MKKLIVIIAFVVVGYKVLTIYQAADTKLEPQYPAPYIVIYGLKTSGDTVHLQTELLNKQLRYHYVDMDIEGSADALKPRLKQAGFDPTSYTLPVVEVNGRIRSNPPLEWVIETYRASPPGKKP